MYRLMGLLIVSGAMQAQNLPEAPRHDIVKPFALSVGVAGRFHNNPSSPYGLETTFNVGVDYRLPLNKIRVGAFYGYVPTTDTHTITLSANYKLLEWGRRR